MDCSHEVAPSLHIVMNNHYRPAALLSKLILPFEFHIVSWLYIINKSSQSITQDVDCIQFPLWHGNMFKITHLDKRWPSRLWFWSISWLKTWKNWIDLSTKTKIWKRLIPNQILGLLCWIPWCIRAHCIEEMGIWIAHQVMYSLFDLHQRVFSLY